MMKPGEKGFTLVELLISVAVTALIAVAAGSAIFQIFQSNDRNSDHMTAVRQVQNAGYWISRDAQRAQIVYAGNLTPYFLVVKWTEWIPDEQTKTGVATYYSATYTFEELTNGIGRLVRSYLSPTGVSENITVASHIYYDPSDADNTSRAIYESPVLTVRLTALSENARETREYRVKRRTNY